MECLPLNVKSNFNGELRRFRVEDEPLYAALERQLRELYAIPHARIKVQYHDDENDLVAFSTEKELQEALKVTCYDPSGGRPFRVSLQVDAPAPAPAAPGPAASAAAPAAAGEVPAARAADSAEHSQPWRSRGGYHRGQHHHHHHHAHHAQHQHHHGQRRYGWGSDSGANWRQRPEGSAAPAEGDARDAESAGADLEPRQRQKEIKRELKELKMQRKEYEREFKESMKMIKMEKKRASKEFHARFVKHVSISDGLVVPPNLKFVKTWRFRNEGKSCWPADTKLLFVSKQNGDLLGAEPEVPIGYVVDPNGEVDVSVEMESPARPGSYCGYWRLALPSGRKFGQRVWVRIQVLDVQGSSGPADGDAEKGEGAAATDLEDAIARYSGEITALSEAGYGGDVRRNCELLAAHGGDLQQVLQVLRAPNA